MIIFSKSFPGRQYRFDGPDDVLYTKSESGWIDQKCFLPGLKNSLKICCCPAASAVVNR